MVSALQAYQYRQELIRSPSYASLSCQPFRHPIVSVGKLAFAAENGSVVVAERPALR
jgi:hypothetical protein